MAPARAKYRGATWSVSLRPGAASGPGLYRIVEVIGSRLVVEKVQPEPISRSH